MRWDTRGGGRGSIAVIADIPPQEAKTGLPGDPGQSRVIGEARTSPLMNADGTDQEADDRRIAPRAEHGIDAEMIFDN
jgi:hypothetical protein